MKTSAAFPLLILPLLIAGCAHSPTPSRQGAARLEVPDFQAVRSKTIAAIRYMDKDLDIRFADGSVQRFAPVPEPLARDFFASGGKYGFFLANIKPAYDRTILAKSYQNRSATREIAHVRTHWLEGSEEWARYTVLENGNVVRSSESRDLPVSESRKTLSQR